jgi:hypothetical protein
VEELEIFCDCTRELIKFFPKIFNQPPIKKDEKIFFLWRNLKFLWYYSRPTILQELLLGLNQDEVQEKILGRLRFLSQFYFE